MARPSKQTSVASLPAYNVSTVKRALDVLKSFSALRPELGLADISSLTGLNKATTLRLLTTLVRGGLVHRSPSTSLYRLGLEILTMAEIAKTPNDLVALARPVMQMVRERLNETVVIAIRLDDHRVNLEQLVGLRELRRVVAIGEPKPLYVSASSKVLLAAMSDAEVTNYLGRTTLKPLSRTTIVDKAKLLREIKTIRRNGYAEAINEGNSDGAAISAGIRDRSGKIVAAFTVTVPVSRFTKSYRERIIEEVVRGAEIVSREMGGLRAMMPARRAS